MEMDFNNEWAKFIIAMVGMATGYGVLQQKVSSTKEELKEHKILSHSRVTKIEEKVDEVEKTLEGLKSTVSSIDQRTDRIDTKIDRLLERNH